MPRLHVSGALTLWIAAESEHVSLSQATIQPWVDATMHWQAVPKTPKKFSAVRLGALLPNFLAPETVGPQPWLATLPALWQACEAPKVVGSCSTGQPCTVCDSTVVGPPIIPGAVRHQLLPAKFHMLWPAKKSSCTDTSCPFPKSVLQFWAKDNQCGLCNFTVVIASIVAFKKPCYCQIMCF